FASPKLEQFGLKPSGKLQFPSKTPKADLWSQKPGHYSPYAPLLTGKAGEIQDFAVKSVVKRKK
ncbi:MAG: hypothetical protein JSU96_19135, partial [Acidobacteriota bacterium]